MTDKEVEKDEVKLRVDADTRQALDDIVGRLSQALMKKPHWAEALRVELRDAAAKVLKEAAVEIEKRTDKRLAEERAQHERLLKETADRVEDTLRGKPGWTEPFRAELRDAVFEVFQNTQDEVMSGIDKRLDKEVRRIVAEVRELIATQDERLQRIEEALQQIAKPWYKRIGG